MRQLNFAGIFIGVLLLLSLPTILTECEPEFERRAPELSEAVCHVEDKVQRSKWEYLYVCTDGVTTLYHYTGTVKESALLERVSQISDSLQTNHSHARK